MALGAPRGCQGLAGSVCTQASRGIGGIGGA